MPDDVRESAPNRTDVRTDFRTDVHMPIQELIVFAFGVVLIVVGIGVRAGKLRRWQAHYENNALPLFMRNAVFLLIPGGAVLMLAAVGMAESSGRGLSPLSAAAAGIVIAGMGLILLAMNRPPEVLKPSWFRDEQRAGRLRPVPDAFDRLVAVGTVGLVALVLVMFLALLVMAGREPA
jgi:hypothetical protein